MKFLILGCNGMAGHTVTLYLKERGYDVAGFARNNCEFVKTITGNAFDSELLKQIIINGKYDSVVNCIGILNQYAEQNKSDAVYINAFLPHMLENLTKDTKTQVIHLSTDCVFSGKSGQYRENAFRDGETFYDRSKALGELENKKDLTIRTSIIGPDLSERGIGLLNWFMQQKESVQGYTKAIWTGLTTLQLAKVIELTSKKKISGLLNVVPDKSINKYELLCLVKRYMRTDNIRIVKSDKIVIDKSLMRSDCVSDFDIPDYETMIIELAKWTKNHRTLYPQYDLDY